MPGMCHGEFNISIGICYLLGAGQKYTCRDLWPFHERGWCGVCRRKEEEFAARAVDPQEAEK